MPKREATKWTVWWVFALGFLVANSVVGLIAGIGGRSVVSSMLNVAFLVYWVATAVQATARITRVMAAPKEAKDG